MPTPVPAPRLSKSRYTQGLQCLRQLWWRVHEPDAPELEPDPVLAWRFEQGRRVGALAREHVPGGVLIDRPWGDFEGRLEATRAAIGNGARVLYEAAFAADGVFVAVDILEREGEAWNLIEVKSSTGVKEVHLPDAALQAHVLRAAGLRLGRVEVMHLNRACRYPDLGDLFVRSDVTEEVNSRLDSVPGEVAAQLEALAGACPEVAPGPHCETPYPCPFMARCWRGEAPPHPVATLYRARREQLELIAGSGAETIDEVDPDLLRGSIQRRQHQAVTTGEVVVAPGLGAALRFREPIAILDFETVAPPVPVWPGCGPYTPVPVQMSVQRLEVDGTVRHVEHLANGDGDPRPELVERLLEACDGAATVLAWGASYERQCIEHLAGAVPERAQALRALGERVVDLLPVVREHVYHPDFEGSFSLKRVLPALVEGGGYQDLEVGSGEVATVWLEQLLTSPDALDGQDVERLRRALLAYCRRDTEGLVWLLRRLRSLADEPRGTPGPAAGDRVAPSQGKGSPGTALSRGEPGEGARGAPAGGRAGTCSGTSG